MKKKVKVISICIVLALTTMACSNKQSTSFEEDSLYNVAEKSTESTLNTDAATNAITFQKYDEFKTSFTELISQVPGFTFFQLEDVLLEDGATCHAWHIKDSIINVSYRLQVNSNIKNEVTFVCLSTERKSYGNLDFAVFSYYAYTSMGFSELVVDEFYEKFDLFSKENIFEQALCNGYEITSMTIDKTNEIVFSISPSN